MPVAWAFNSFTSVCGQYSVYMDRAQTVPLGRHSGSRGHPWKSRPTRGTPSRESFYLPLSRRASAVLDQPGAGAFKCFRGNQHLPQPPDLTKRHLLPSKEEIADRTQGRLGWIWGLEVVIVRTMSPSSCGYSCSSGPIWLSVSWVTCAALSGD